MTELELLAEIERLKNLVRKEFQEVENIDFKNHTLKIQNENYKDALKEIATAGMTLPIGCDEAEAINFHARQAWKFIKIAATALD